VENLKSAVIVAFLFSSCFAWSQTSRWSEQKANDWYAQQPWLVGSNYVPKSAINELEMWQQDTFDPTQIDKELGWAESLGMNTMRVFLHDLLWQQDAINRSARSTSTTDSSSIPVNNTGNLWFIDQMIQSTDDSSSPAVTDSQSSDAGTAQDCSPDVGSDNSSGDCPCPADSTSYDAGSCSVDSGSFDAGSSN
jgi:hypothetical protein